MKNILKRALLVLVALTVVTSLFACAKKDTAANTTGNNQNVSTTKRTEQIKLGFFIYKWSDDQGLYLDSYLKYLEASELNIKVFETEDAQSTPEGIVTAVENMIASGCQAVAVATDTGFQTWAQVCEDAGVYYTIMLGCLTDEDDIEFAKDCKYYLGSCGRESYESLGTDYANAIVAQGKKNVLIVGPTQGLQDQADQMVAGAKAVLDAAAGVTYKELRASWGDLYGSVMSNLTDEYDAVYCPLSVYSFAAPQIATKHLTGTTYAYGHGTSKSSLTQYGSIVSIFSDNLTTSVGANVAMMINAIEGNGYKDYSAKSGNFNITAPVLFVDSEEDFASYSQYVRNFSVEENVYNSEKETYYVTVSDVENMIVSYNANATYASVKAYIEGITMDSINAKAANK